MIICANVKYFFYFTLLLRLFSLLSTQNPPKTRDNHIPYLPFQKYGVTYGRAPIFSIGAPFNHTRRILSARIPDPAIVPTADKIPDQEAARQTITRDQPVLAIVPDKLVQLVTAPLVRQDKHPAPAIPEQTEGLVPEETPTNHALNKAPIAQQKAKRTSTNRKKRKKAPKAKLK